MNYTIIPLAFFFCFFLDVSEPDRKTKKGTDKYKVGTSFFFSFCIEVLRELGVS